MPPLILFKSGTCIEIIDGRQRYETLKEIRVKKVEAVSRLRKTNKELNLLMAKMRKAMPKADMRIPEKRVDTKFEGDDLAKLESELKKIQQKISMIG